LREVLDLCKDKIVVNIELKGNHNAVVEKVFELVDELKMWDQITVSSFHHPYYAQMEEAKRRMKITERIYFGFLAHKIEEIPDYSTVQCQDDDSLNLDIQLLTSHRHVILEKIEKAKEKKTKNKILFPNVG